ncbi:MAG: hypothetical protein ACD_10C00827G0002 [uncultured bacterium]|nr:MAG: hypothetical protein ACD_10C00827G0002 [uncultured bacterium]
MPDFLTASALLTDRLIGSICRLNLLRTGLAPDRHITHDQAFFAQRRGVGNNPVVIAILAAIFNHTRPRPTCL